MDAPYFIELLLVDGYLDGFITEVMMQWAALSETDNSNQLASTDRGVEVFLYFDKFWSTSFFSVITPLRNIFNLDYWVNCLNQLKLN